MINHSKLNDVLSYYKKDFVLKQWPDEKYKWEAIKCFQDNWDINASDFAEMLLFSNVDTLDPTMIKWSYIRFQRNNQNYRMLISICQLIIEGMLLTTDSGDYHLATFIDEQRMCRLYEKFILEYYAQNYRKLSVKASQIPWALDDGIGTMLPIMQSDITLQQGNTVLIIDAKYYSHTTQQQFDKHTIHSNNLYQIFTYVKIKNMSLKEKNM